MSVKSSVGVVTDGLVFYVDAGNGNSYDGVSGGTTWADLVGGNDGTLTNMETNPSSGSYDYSSANGGSLAFDGANDHATSSNSISYIQGESRSLEVWINPTSPSFTGNQSVVWTGQPSATKIFEILMSSNYPTEANYRVIGHYYGGGNSMTDSNTTYNVIPNQWNHIVLTQAGANSHNIYVNGSLTATKSANMTSSSTGAVRLTTPSWSGAYYCNAKYGACKYYSKALSATEVLQNYNALKNRFI